MSLMDDYIKSYKDTEKIGERCLITREGKAHDWIRPESDGGLFIHIGEVSWHIRLDDAKFLRNALNKLLGEIG